MRAMETVQDLIEEAKVRMVWWGLIIFSVAYFLSNTSKSLWMNVPVAILVVSALRILIKEVEFRWKPRSQNAPITYLSYLNKKQLSLNDPRLSIVLPPAKWKRKIDSPAVEAAADEFIGKLLRDFVVDLWYSDITSDKEFPELVRCVIMEAIGEISGRVKQLNLVDLLTRDIVDLVGDHIDLFRRNQAAIGADVMGILSSEERDDRLKHHLMASKELHPALISPECEYKVLQRLMEGVLAVVLGPREVKCPLVRCIARELVTCLVLKPVMDFASPNFVNEIIELVMIAMKDNGMKDTDDGPKNTGGHQQAYVRASEASQDVQSVSRNSSSSDSGNNINLVKDNFQTKSAPESLQIPSANWARVMEAATQRRSEVLTPENLENMWARGRHYNTKVPKNSRAEKKGLKINVSDANCFNPTRELGKDLVDHKLESPEKEVNQTSAQLPPQGTHKRSSSYYEVSQESNVQVENKLYEVVYHQDELRRDSSASSEDSGRQKRPLSVTMLQEETDQTSLVSGGLVISEDFYGSSSIKSGSPYSTSIKPNMVPQIKGKTIPKLRCQVVGASFEKIGSNPITVYSISVKDEENMTWHVKRRYSNFERLHRLLKSIPNYTLNLPPKRVFSSSTEDKFVHQRCIQLNRYLQDLLSIANVAEHHEVWDFFSVSSKNYSFGKSASVMKSLAVNVDDAVDDIVRQFKGVADGLTRKVVGSSPYLNEASPSMSARNIYYDSDEMGQTIPRVETKIPSKISDNEEEDKDEVSSLVGNKSTSQAKGRNSNNEQFEVRPPSVSHQVGEQSKESEGSNSKQKTGADLRLEWAPPERLFSTSSSISADQFEDPVGMPPEWSPPNVSVPVLNLVDKVFQLKRRGWLRRQVFWISKQILQLMMEDAIDDWLLRQVHWLRREDVVAQGIRWIQNILWPGGTFFRRLAATQSNIDDNTSTSTYDTASSSTNKASETGSFKQHLEETRRANEVRKLLLERAPTTLVSLIGQKQYKRCAKDIYYFSQSTICVKQLAYGALELLIISVFPELREVVIDIHKQMRGKPIL